MTRLAYHFILGHAARRATRNEFAIARLSWWALYAFALYLGSRSMPWRASSFGYPPPATESAAGSRSKTRSPPRERQAAMVGADPLSHRAADLHRHRALSQRRLARPG